MSESTNLSLQAETLREIQQKAIDAAGAGGKVAVVNVPSRGPQTQFLVVRPSGDYEVMSAGAVPRSHQFESLEEIPGYVAYARESHAAEPVIWHGRESVIVVLNDGPESLRDDQAELPLEKTPEFNLIESWSLEGSEEFTQKQLIKLLRTHLSACETDKSLELLTVIRDLAATTSTSASGSVGHARESLGRDIEQEVSSRVGAIPDSTLFRVRPFTDRLLDSTFPIVCAVEIDPKMLTIQLFPRPDDVREAVASCHELIGEYLKREAADTPTFFGSP